MMKKLFKLAACLTVAATFTLGLQSCNSVKPLDQSQLAGYWVLTELEGQDAKALFKGPIPTLEFNFADSQVAGSAGCNRYFGKFEISEKNEFNAANLGSTMMACAFENKEDQFLKTLSAPATISLDKAGSLLSLVKGENVVLKFTKGENPANKKAVTAEDLVGDWTLKAIHGKDITEVFKDKTPTITFNAEGGVNGNAGCNNFRTQYELSEDKITFGPLMSTKMACPSLEGETLLTTMLSVPSNISINGDVLSIQQKGITLLEYTKN